MVSMKLEGFEQNLPDQMPISVVMEKTPSQHKWIDFSYKAIGVIAGQITQETGVKKIHQEKLEKYHLKKPSKVLSLKQSRQEKKSGNILI